MFGKAAMTVRVLKPHQRDPAPMPPPCNVLPCLTHQTTDWQDNAACQGMDSVTFYAKDGQRASSLRRQERDAKTVCRPCPVIQHCLKYALDTREAWGVWGGTTARERQHILANSSPNRSTALRPAG